MMHTGIWMVLPFIRICSQQSRALLLALSLITILVGALVPISASADVRALHSAAARGSAVAAGSEIDKGTAVDATLGGWTALMTAAFSGQASAAAELIRRGADPNFRSSDGVTPLIAATENGSEVTVKVLLRGGADPDRRDKNGMSARQFATNQNATRIIALFDARESIVNSPLRTTTPEPVATARVAAPGQHEGAGTEISAHAERVAAAVSRCWMPPRDWSKPEDIRVVLEFVLNPDGTIRGRPAVLEKPQGRFSSTAAKAAMRAVVRCAPYGLPRQHYAKWKQVRLTFSP